MILRQINLFKTDFPSYPRMWKLFGVALGSTLLVYKLSWLAIFFITWVLGACACTLGSYLSLQGAVATYILSTTVLLGSTLVQWLCSLSSGSHYLYHIGDYGLLSSSYKLSFIIKLDNYSLSYIVLTNTIGLFALLFATNYMRGEPRVTNFLNLLFFFLLSMVLLLASGNMPSLMLGWELIGCFSFLLINFWVSRVATFKSSFKAFTFNKLSDASLILGFLILVVYAPNSLAADFNDLYILEGLYLSFFGFKASLFSFFVVSLVVCSFCKSAQLGFHAWLPDSMEAPVPASALIHSATLVSAGIFLLGRSSSLLTVVWVNELVLVWCSLTAFYGGLVAAYQTDLKKILAYSTISHCGFLFILVIYSNTSVLILYLHLHGWFKSYSFMASGNIISKYLGYQDTRRMGGSSSLTTLESLVLSISLACLGGLPFMLGFFNKHYLLLLHTTSATLISQIFVQAAAFTGLFYTQKTLRGLFRGPSRTNSFNNSALVHGLPSSRLVSSEPYSNILLFLVYTFAIAVLATLVVTQIDLSTSVVYHSAFGILFFYTYIISWLCFHKFNLTYLLVAVMFTKLLYVVIL